MSTPKHGDERNRRYEVEKRKVEYRDLVTGDEISVEYDARSGTAAEIWCDTCKEWVAVGVGSKNGLLGFILCPQCSTEWDPKEGG